MHITFNITHGHGNTLVSEPDGAIDGRYEYKIGRTVVKVTETNKVGSSKTCIFNVLVFGEWIHHHVKGRTIFWTVCR